MRTNRLLIKEWRAGKAFLAAPLFSLCLLGFGLPAYRTLLNTMDREIASRKAELERYRRDLAREGLLPEVERTRLLSEDRFRPEINVVLKFLDGQAKRSGLRLVGVHPQFPDPTASGKEPEVELQAAGPARALGDFLYALSQARPPVTVERISVRSDPAGIRARMTVR